MLTTHNAKQNIEDNLSLTELGKRSVYSSHYDKTLLCAIPRALSRAEIGITGELPFSGFDLWTAYELSWLNQSGKPVVATADLIFPCNNPAIIESKSLKLYFNSLNQTQFKSVEMVQSIIQNDLAVALNGEVVVQIHVDAHKTPQKISLLKGFCLDDLDIDCDTYSICPEYLRHRSSDIVEETLVSHLLKSNCPVTCQPDWASVQINYRGQAIDHHNLLRYIISFRNHNEFHEQCVERIFQDIKKYCIVESLEVYARFTRRGGIDINPFRSSENIDAPSNNRLFRQ